MPVHAFVHSLGSIGIFPSRAFLPAFVAAILLRFGASVPLVAEAGLGGNVDAPSWFVSNTSLVVLAILSFLECWTTKNADVREFLDQFDGAVKPAMTLLTSFGVASAHDAELVRAIQQAGLSDGLFGLMAAGTVFFLTSARRSLFELLTEIGADDSLGIQKLCSWAEDAWVVFGAVMLIEAAIKRNAAGVADLGVAVVVQDIRQIAPDSGHNSHLVAPAREEGFWRPFFSRLVSRR